MWTANIESKDLKRGVLTVVVKYENETESFGESYIIGSFEELNATVEMRLKHFNRIEKAVIPLGVFVPSVVTLPDVV